MRVRKEKPDVCWNCGYPGTAGEDAHMELDDQMWECRDTLRFAIKKDLDTHFVEERYDETSITGGPKAFWLDPYEQRYVEEREVGEAAFSQAALYEFTRDS